MRWMRDGIDLFGCWFVAHVWNFILQQIAQRFAVGELPTTFLFADPMASTSPKSIRKSRADDDVPSSQGTTLYMGSPKRSPRPQLRRARAFIQSPSPKTEAKQKKVTGKKGVKGKNTRGLKSMKVMKVMKVSKFASKIVKGKARAKAKAVAKSSSKCSSPSSSSKGLFQKIKEIAKKPASKVKTFARTIKPKGWPTVGHPMVPGTAQEIFDATVANIRQEWMDLVGFNRSFKCNPPCTWEEFLRLSLENARILVVSY